MIKEIEMIEEKEMTLDEYKKLIPADTPNREPYGFFAMKKELHEAACKSLKVGDLTAIISIQSTDPNLGVPAVMLHFPQVDAQVVTVRIVEGSEK